MPGSTHPRRPWHTPTTLRARGLAAALCLTGLATLAPAQSGGNDPVWVSLDGSPEGTAATLSLLPGQSTSNRTSAQLSIHGFWREDVLGPDGQTYQRLDFPGLEPMHTPGEPSLPVAVARLAVGTDATQAVPTSPVVTGQAFVSNIRPLPAAIPGEDEEFDPTGDPGPGDTNGTDEQWILDSAIYGGSQGVWPSTTILGGPVEPQLGPLSGATVAVHPVSWDPASKRLIIKTSMQVGWDHLGSTGAPLVLTKLKHKLFAASFLNWSALGPLFPVEPYAYHSRYLIVAQVWWWDTLQPFVKLKKAQGYEVTLVPNLPDVDSVRGIIADWYAAGDPGMDHFALLVGDTELIPLGVVFASNTVVQTDDVYGTVGAINASKEVHVGRLSIDSEADLANQLAKIIAYQTNPVPGGRYDHALLVAHKQGYPGKYTGSHLDVLGANYSKPPFFLTSFGATGATNTQVTNFIDNGVIGDGVGLVAYRGHGSTSTWSDWNLAEENWHSNDVMFLDNPLRPVVWSIACTNANLDFEFGTGQDCLSEVWMEVADGAVASYAATQTTSTTPNHLLNEALFQAVFNFGITTHAMAIETAEAVIWALWPGHKNPWSYLLLGDPSMVIRREQAADIVVGNIPSGFKLGDGGGEVSIQALLSNTGAPLQDGLLSFYKPSFLNGADDELQGAFWLNESGQGTLPLTALTPGVLKVMIRDLDGNVSCHDVEVAMGDAWTDLGESLVGPGGVAMRLAGLGPLTAGSTAELLLSDAAPFSTVWMAFGASQLNAPFKGGVLVPDIAAPGGVLPLTTDANGNIQLSTSWPAGLPSDTELVFQGWAADEDGPAGWVASNGLLGRTP